MIRLQLGAAKSRVSRAVCSHSERHNFSSFADARVRRFEQLLKDAAANVVHNPASIKVRCRLEKEEHSFDATSAWRPIEALKLFQKIDPANPVVAAMVNGRPCSLGEAVQATEGATGALVVADFLTFSSIEGRRVFWHSAAHVLGAALETELGNKVALCDGPATLDAEGGFFYEFQLQRDLSSATFAAESGELSTAGAAGPGGVVNEAMLAPLEQRMKEVVKQRHAFQRVVVTPEVAAGVFAENPFKLDILARIPPAQPVSLYRCGPFVDLCRGPHVPHTGLFRGINLYRVAGSHWRGELRHPGDNGGSVNTAAGAAAAPHILLHRVYGTAFPTPAGLMQWQRQIEEAKRRDHRVIGRQQELFFFHEHSPGSAFFLPHGTRIYNRLLSWLRDEYRRRGYEEVITPLIYKRQLWHTSGHLQAYGEHMFSVTPGIAALHAPPSPQLPAACATASSSSAPSAEAAAVAAAAAEGQQHLHHQCQHGHGGGSEEADEHEVFGLKPMNCPGHCLIFKHPLQRVVSYKDLPLRLADFSSLHRNEATGALGGLTRLRRFQQDDAHVFCAPAQIEAEVAGCLAFVAHVYGALGFSFRAKLSTRPAQYVGELDNWQRAEAALEQSLTQFVRLQRATARAEAADASAEGAAEAEEAEYEVDEGGGAFYGPKIDVFVRDAIGREHQCATVQLDFNLPQRFGLHYTDSDGERRAPVMIHRAILGSVERMLGILIEHTGGRWPFWLSPRQLVVCAVNDRNNAYAAAAVRCLTDAAATHEAGGVAPAVAAAAALAPGPDTLDPSRGLRTPGACAASLHVDLDDSARTVPKKVRDAQVAQYSVIAVAGDAEEAAGSLTLRFRDAATWAAFARAAGRASVVLPAASEPVAASPAAAVAGAQGAAAANGTPIITLPLLDAKRVCVVLAAERWHA